MAKVAYAFGFQAVFTGAATQYYNQTALQFDFEWTGLIVQRTDANAGTTCKATVKRTFDRLAILDSLELLNLNPFQPFLFAENGMADLQVPKLVNFPFTLVADGAMTLNVSLLGNRSE